MCGTTAHEETVGAHGTVARAGRRPGAVQSRRALSGDFCENEPSRLSESLADVRIPDFWAKDSSSSEPKSEHTSRSSSAAELPSIVGRLTAGLGGAGAVRGRAGGGAGAGAGVGLGARREEG